MQQNAKFIRKLPIPMDIKKEFPVTEEVAKVREARVEEMRAILDGRDSRLMLIIGPCSADREDSVMDYVCRLVPLQEKVKDKILIVPRIYTNKPRTNGSGYKGMLHQPDPSKKPDMLEASSPSAVSTPARCRRLALPVPTRCSIPKTTAICLIFWAMSPSARARLRTSSTASSRAVLMCPSA